MIVFFLGSFLGGGLMGEDFFVKLCVGSLGE